MNTAMLDLNTSASDQLNAVLAFVYNLPCRCMSVAQLGERDAGCDRCQAADRLSNILTNVARHETELRELQSARDAAADLDCDERRDDAEFWWNVAAFRGIELCRQIEQVQAAEGWREAVGNACVIANINYDDDPVASLARLIGWHEHTALDPQISSRAAMLLAADGKQAIPDAGDWYRDEATGSYVVDWDADPQRQLSIMLKPDGRVAYAVYVEGKRFHGPDAMNTGFMEAIREWGNSETREVTNNLIASLIDISEVGIEGEEREWTDAGHKACSMMAYETISENEWFFGGRSKPEPVKSPHDWKYRIKDGWPRTWKVPPINQQRNEYFEKRHEWGELAYEMGRFINLIRPRLVGDEISLSYTLQNLMNKWAYQPRKDVK